MSATPRVSVLMPSYNHAPFVAQAIESVLGQSYSDLELIVVDDGSTDGTPDVVSRYAGDPRVRIEVFSVNQGAATATNHCRSMARGEFVALLNSDDVFLPDKVAQQVDLLDRHPGLAAVFSQVQFIDERGEPVDDAANPFATLFRTTQPHRFAWLRMFFLRGNGLCHPTILARKSVYDTLGPFDPAYRQLHDFDMWVRLCAHHPIHVMPRPTVAYRVLLQGGNASAPGPAVFRRTVWEHSRLRHRYRSMDDETLRRAFRADLPDHITARRLPASLLLALAMAERPEPEVQLFALETMQDAIDRCVPGVSPHDLHAMAGAVDPLRILEFAALQAAADDATHHRDVARLRVDALAIALDQTRIGLRSIANEVDGTLRGLRGV